MEACDLAPCESCGRRGVILFCSRCRVVSYCDVACQRAKWPSHKADCRVFVSALGGALGSTPMSVRFPEILLLCGVIRQVYHDHPDLPATAASELPGFESLLSAIPAVDLAQLNMRQLNLILRAMVIFSVKQDQARTDRNADDKVRIDGTSL